MSLDYVLKRIGLFVLIVWLAGTVNFFLPRLSGIDPIRQQLVAQAALGGSVQAGLKDMIKEYDQKFGLDKPLWQQYVTYMTAAVQLDFSTSTSHYPIKVGASLDNRAIDDNHDFLVDYWKSFGRVFGVAANTKVGEVRHATVVNVERRPVFPVWPNPHLRAGFSLEALPAIWWLRSGIDSGFDSKVSVECLAAHGSAGALDHFGVTWRLGPGHAWHDGDNAGGRFHDLCRCERPQGIVDFSSLRGAQRTSTSIDRPCSGTWKRRCWCRLG
jgi:hypothetical protein